MKKFVLLLALMFPFMVNAATISVSGNTSLSPGETSTLSLIVTSDKKIYGGQVNFTLNSDNFDILIDQSTTSYGTIIKSTNPAGVAVISLEKVIPNKGVLAKIKVKAKTSATVGETANLVLKNVILTVKDGDKNVDDQAKDYTKVLTVAVPKSTNNYLASLTIDGYPITFDKETTSYNIDIPTGLASLKITATAEDEKATVKVTGNTTLKEGKNTIAVTVTAENGTKKVYNIYATMPETKPVVSDTNCNLGSLEIKGYVINFDPNKTEYRVNVPNETTKIEITSTLANPESNKTTEGPNTLAVGENTYSITVTDKDQNKKIYRVIVKRAEGETKCEVCEKCETCEEKDNNIWKILAIILVIVTLSETIYMVTLRDRKQI